MQVCIITYRGVICQIVAGGSLKPIEDFIVGQ